VSERELVCFVKPSVGAYEELDSHPFRYGSRRARQNLFSRRRPREELNFFPVLSVKTVWNTQ